MRMTNFFVLGKIKRLNDVCDDTAYLGPYGRCNVVFSLFSRIMVKTVEYYGKGQNRMDQAVIDLYDKGVGDPAMIAEQLQLPLEEVQRALLHSRRDWNTPARVGRPRKQLLLGQERLIEARVRQGSYTQEGLAAEVGITVARLCRFLTERGLYQPKRGQPAETTLRAVELYLEGESVLTIFDETGVWPPTLYSALRRRNIALRSRLPKETTSNGTT